MLELLIARHARAAGEPGVDDFARPLDARGEQDAPRMAARLHAAGLRPQRMLASPALRTMTTARALAAGLGFDPADIETDPAIWWPCSRPDRRTAGPVCWSATIPA